jgi:hypothetical protein
MAASALEAVEQAGKPGLTQLPLNHWAARSCTREGDLELLGHAPPCCLIQLLNKNKPEICLRQLLQTVTRKRLQCFCLQRLMQSLKGTNVTLQNNGCFVVLCLKGYFFGLLPFPDRCNRRLFKQDSPLSVCMCLTDQHSMAPCQHAACCSL